MATRGNEFYLRVLKVSLMKVSLSQNAFHKNVMKLRYKVIKEK